MLEIEDLIPKLKEKKLLIQGAHSPVHSIQEGVSIYLFLKQHRLPVQSFRSEFSFASSCHFTDQTSPWSWIITTRN